MPALDASSFPSTEVSLCLRPSIPEETLKFLPIVPTYVSFPGLKASLWPGSEQRHWAERPLALPGMDLTLRPEANGPSSEPHGPGALEQKEALADGTEGKHQRPQPNTHSKVRWRDAPRDAKGQEQARLPLVPALNAQHQSTPSSANVPQQAAWGGPAHCHWTRARLQGSHQVQVEDEGKSTNPGELCQGHGRKISFRLRRDPHKQLSLIGSRGDHKGGV